MIHTVKPKTAITLIMLTALLSGLLMATVWADESPIVTTDKADYSPEETVVISGVGFIPNTEYAIPVIRPDSTIVYGNGSFISGWDTVQTDENGCFTYYYILDGVQGTYEVRVYESTWTGGVNETSLALTTFTDSGYKVNVVDATDSSGSTPGGSRFDPGANIYAEISTTGGTGTLTVDIYVLDDLPGNNQPLSDVTTIAAINDVVLHATTSGQDFGPYLVWSSATRGQYYIFVDTNQDGTKESSDAYDSFIVSMPATSISAALTVSAHWDDTYTWSIDKEVSPDTLYLAPSETDDVDYKVTIDNDGGVDTYYVDGIVTVTNGGSNPTDMLQIVINLQYGGPPEGDWETIDTMTLDLSGHPIVAAGSNYGYSYSISIPAGDINTGDLYRVIADVSILNHAGSLGEVWTQSPKDTSTLPSTPNVVDDSVTVSDSLEGSLGTVSYTDTVPYEFKYSRTIGPYSIPGQYTEDNTATYETDDTGATDDASARVTVYVEGSSFCTVTSRGYQELTNDEFKLIFTPDMPANPGYSRLTASNPGQFSYNVFYDATNGDEVFVLTIPFPFVTQGAVPVLIYDASPDGFTPTGSVINSQFTIDGVPVTLESYTGTGTFGDTTTITITDNGYTGPVYITVHLDYGLKKVAGDYSKNLDLDAIAGTASTHDSIVNEGDYQFSVSDAFECYDTVHNLNTFKNDPGIGGLVLDEFGNPLPNVRVDIYQGKKIFGTAYTDADGWYMYNFKYTGKPTSFTVEVTGFEDQTVTLKANGFLVVNFGY